MDNKQLRTLDNDAKVKIDGETFTVAQKQDSEEGTALFLVSSDEKQVLMLAVPADAKAQAQLFSGHAHGDHWHFDTPKKYKKIE